MDAMDYDELLSHISPSGRYAWMAIAGSGMFVFLDCFVFMTHMFVAAVPDHWCHLPQSGDQNITVSQAKEWLIPLDNVDGLKTYSQCKIYNRTDITMGANATHSDVYTNVTAPTIGCPSGWDYDRSVYQSTIVMEWDLVCDYRAMPAISQSVFMAGVMVGIISLGFLADRFGRRKVALIMCFVYIGAPATTALSVNLTMYMICRFIAGMTCLAMSYTVFVLAAETVGPTWRITLNCVACYFWVAAFLVLGGLAYLMREWRHLQLVTGICSIVSLVVIIMSPESPRWLYAKGRTEEADRNMAKIAKWNGTSMPGNTRVLMKTSECDVYIWRVAKYPRLRLRTLIIFYMWFTCSLVYYGLSMTSTELGSNAILSFVLSGVAEIPAYVFCHVGLDRLGRRKVSSGSLLLAGVALLCTLAIPVHLKRGWIMMTLANVGKIGATAAFTANFVLTTEIFPTVLRTSGLSSASFFARIGGIIAPQMALLGEFNPYIPFVTFGSCSVVAGVLSLLLPETARCRLPETLEEAENFGRSAHHDEQPEEMTELNRKEDKELHT